MAGVTTRPYYKQAAVAAAATGDRTIVAKIAGKQIAVHAVHLTSDSAAKGTIRFESAAGGTALSGIIELGQDDGTRVRPQSFVLPFSSVPWMMTDSGTAAGEDLSLEVGGSAINGVIIYSVIDDPGV